MISKRVLYCVLTVFLAAVVLTGTASAEDTRTVGNGSTVFVYENISLSDAPEGATLTHYSSDGQTADNTISAENGVFVLKETTVKEMYGRYYYSGSSSPEDGKYLEICHPDITLKAELTGESGGTSGNSIDGKSINKKTNITFIIEVPRVGPALTGATAKIVFTTPAGGTITTFGNDSSGTPKDYSTISLNQAEIITGAVVPGKNSMAGTWTAQAEFVTPASFKDSVKKSNTISYTVQSSTLIITTARDSVVRGTQFDVTILGDTDILYAVYLSGTQITGRLPVLQSGQEGFKQDYSADDLGSGYSAQNGVINYTTGDTTVAVGGIFATNESGKRTVRFNTTEDTEDKTYTVKVAELTSDNKIDSDSYDSVMVKVEKGAVTISALGDGSYYVGEEIKLTGTNTDSNNVFLFITGQNLAENGIVLKDLPKNVAAHLATNPVAVKTDDTWEYKWNTTNSELASGTYTIYATSRLTNGKSTEANGTAVKLIDAEYASTSLMLKCPSLTLYASPETIGGICEKCSSSSLTYYLAGPDTFQTGAIPVAADGSYHTSTPIDADRPSGIYYVVAERPAVDGTSGTLDEAAVRSIIAGADIPEGKYAIAEFVVGTDPVIPPVSPSGAVTVDASPKAVHVGETITFSGSNTENGSVYLFITGPYLDPYGYQLSNISERTPAGKAGSATASVNSGSWEYPWDTSNCCLDTGTYTIYATDRLTNGKGTIADGTAVSILAAEYATTTIELKQPSFTMTPSAYYVQKGETLSINGTATGDPHELAYYLFGPNTYLHATASVQNDGSYEITIPTTTAQAQDQYYLIIEHPMYNDELDIIETKTDSTTTLSVKYPASGFTTPDPIIVEGTGKLLSVNAANALTTMIDSANIDDIYGKYTFIVYEGTKPQPARPADTDENSSPLPHTILKESYTPSGNLKPGESATAATDIQLQKDTTIYRIDLGSGLENQKWSGSLQDPWGGELIFPADIPSHVDGWLLSDLPGSNVLHLTVTGTVPDTIGKEISQLRLTERGSSETILCHYSSKKQLIIREGTEVSATVPLSKDWNFISIPKTLASGTDSAENLFAYVNTGNHQILGYDAQTSAWKPVQAGEIIKPLTGYWVYAEEPASLMLSFTKDPAVPAVKTVYPGWNAVGLSADTEANAINAFAGTTWIRAIPWNLSKGSYGTAVTNGGTGDNDPAVNPLQPGWGYWLYVEKPGTLTGLTA